jgi:uncharacterized protein YdeI (YjbR/CyaY-like superfamily)
VDEALCFGWIDGVRKGIDDESYVIRFTPRRPGSIWSNNNARRYGELERAGLVRPAGRRAHAARTDARTGIYLFEKRTTAELPAAFAKRFRANRKAWTFFSAQPPGYRKIATWYVIQAKREETREHRLALLIADSAAGRRIGLLQRPQRKP